MLIGILKIKLTNFSTMQYFLCYIYFSQNQTFCIHVHKKYIVFTFNTFFDKLFIHTNKFCLSYKFKLINMTRNVILLLQTKLWAWEINTCSYSLGTCNPSTAFNCGDYTCIPLEYRCDGVPDCQSGEDEIYCVSPETCQEWWNTGYRENGIYKIRKDNVRPMFNITKRQYVIFNVLWSILD